MNTTIEFLKVPYPLDGSHQYLPNANQSKSAKAQERFFRNNFLVKGGTITNRVLVDPNEGMVLVRGKYKIISQANYMMFKNPSYESKMFYAHIVDLRPRAGDETVEVYYSIDPVQTYLMEWYSNVREGHVYREHSNPSNPKWADFTLLDDVPTGKLETVKVIDGIESNSSMYDKHRNQEKIRWAIFVSSKSVSQLEFQGNRFATPIDPDSGLSDGNYYEDKDGQIAQTLYYYAVPVRNDTQFGSGNVLINGNKSISIREMSDFFATDEKAVNSLVKVIIKNHLPIVGVNVENSGYPAKVNAPEDSIHWRDSKALVVIDDRVEVMDINGTIVAQTDDIMSGLHREPRLNYPPYTRYYIETEDGREIEFDVSKLPSYKGRMKLELYYRTNLGPIDNSILQLDRYNLNGDKSGAVPQHSVQYEAYTPFANDNTIPIITNNLSSMLQSQQNQIQAAKTQRKEQAEISTLRAKKSAVIGAAKAIGGGAAMASGAVIGGADVALAGVNQMVDSAIDHKQASKNREWGDLAQEASLNDAKNIPNSVGNMGSDFTYNLINQRTKNMIKIKTVSDRYKKLAIDYIHRYGYATKRLKLPNLTHRANYNYIECELNIASAPIPEKHRMRIKQIFAEGTTLWHTANVYKYNNGNKWISGGSSYHG